MNIWHDRNVLVYEWQLAEALDLLHCGLFNLIGPYLCVRFFAIEYLLHHKSGRTKDKGLLKIVRYGAAQEAELRETDRISTGSVHFLQSAPQGRRIIITFSFLF